MALQAVCAVKLAALLLTLSVLACFSWATPPGSPHLAYKPKGKTLKARETSQQRNLHHARYVASYGKGHNRRWHKRAARWISHELAETRNLIVLRSLAAPQAAICYVFGPYCSQAIAVASCETGGTFWVGARNGQYLGLFQMGSSERATYGHGSTALEQARAAYRYFSATGKDWSPWDPICRP